jgi:hypothetical protein
MTSKVVTLKVLDGIFVGFALILSLVIIGIPLDILLEISRRELEGFSLFMLFGLLSLIHAIASSDSAP